MTFALDPLDREIVERLIENGRSTNRSIARQVGVSEAVVANRIQKLLSSRVLRFTAQQDIFAAGLAFNAYVDITVRGATNEEVARQLAQLEEVFSVTICAEDPTIMIWVAAADEHRFAEVLLYELPQIEGIHEVCTLTPLKILRFTHRLFLGDSTPYLPNHDQGTKTKILEIIAKNARITNREIGDRLNMTEGNVRHHVNSMLKNKQIRISAAVNAEAYGYGMPVFLRLSITLKDLDRACDRLIEIADMGLLTITSGRYNVFCNLSTSGDLSLKGIIDVILRDIPGLISFKSSQARQIVKFNTNVTRIL